MDVVPIQQNKSWLDDDEDDDEYVLEDEEEDDDDDDNSVQQEIQHRQQLLNLDLPDIKGHPKTPKGSSSSSHGGFRREENAEEPFPYRTRAKWSLQDKSVEEVGVDEQTFQRLCQDIVDDEEEDEDQTLYRKFLLEDLPEEDEEEEEDEFELDEFRSNSQRQQQEQQAMRQQHQHVMVRQGSGIANRTRAHISYLDKSVDDLGVDDQTFDLLNADLEEQDEVSKRRKVTNDEETDLLLYTEFLRETLSNHSFSDCLNKSAVPPRHFAPMAFPGPSSSSSNSSSNQFKFNNSRISPTPQGFLFNENSKMSTSSNLMLPFPSPASQRQQQLQEPQPFFSSNESSQGLSLPGFSFTNFLNNTGGSRIAPMTTFNQEQLARLRKLLKSYAQLLFQQQEFEMEDEDDQEDDTDKQETLLTNFRRIAMDDRNKIRNNWNRLFDDDSFYHQTIEFVNGDKERRKELLMEEQQQQQQQSLANEGGIVGGLSFFINPLKVPQNRVHRIANPRTFSVGDDRLLIQGLKRFANRFKAIHEEFLPTKTKEQLHNRFRTRKTMKTGILRDLQGDEPAQFIRPFTSREEDRFMNAIAAHGVQWKTIAEQYFPHRSPYVLSVYYRDLCSKCIPYQDDKSLFRKRVSNAEVSFQWNKEQDKIVLELINKRGGVTQAPDKDFFQTIQQQLKPLKLKLTLGQIKSRYETLMVILHLRENQNQRRQSHPFTL